MTTWRVSEWVRGRFYFLHLRREMAALRRPRSFVLEYKDVADAARDAAEGAKEAAAAAGGGRDTVAAATYAAGCCCWR